MSIKHEPGSIASYVIGFGLSLLLTFVPYYLVTHRSVTGNMLLVTILSFAVIQLLVQVFFFLHLGRGPKPFYNIVFFFATISLIVIAIGGSLFIMNHLYSNMSPNQVSRKLAQDEGIAQVSGQKTGACQEMKANHLVTIANGKAAPETIQAHRCDTLTFVNKDNVLHDIAFGPHPQHEAYGGETDQLVRKGYPKTITLNVLGNYVFHDHLNPQISGQFSVVP